ncbi:2-phospho-L-lactate guanylyltransferase [Nocardioides gilvus]|uniref:2-phospho-L-lactate guanylyltransferase n=1 Tax=Nocardioides gilvus TaxID=1735589 RepID=UPI000D74A439|nr:2-phospho-L-lactate guanylyltransferase [Nocardioides gilvus]
MRAQEFVAVVPVKPLSRGKSRLVGVDPAHRQALAEAFARDTVGAALGTPGVLSVVVVTDDARLARSLARDGCLVVPDGVTGDLNGSLVQAAAEAHRHWPRARPVALCSDLPALVPADLAQVLARIDVRASDRPAFVPDAAGVGTTLYSAPHALFAPRFGGPSRRAHLEAGALEIVDAAAGVRRDVDVVADLDRALALGAGPHTTEVAGRASTTLP